MRISSDEEEKMVILTIVAIRYGIDRESIKNYLATHAGKALSHHQCFLRAIEFNEKIDTICGAGELAVSLIVERVKQFYQDLRSTEAVVNPVKGALQADHVSAPTHIQTATVIRHYRMASPTEISLSQLGQQVVVAEENDIWAYVEIRDTGECGWVPREALSYNEQTMESLSPTHTKGDRTFPRLCMDTVRIEEKQAYRDQLKNEVNVTRMRVNHLLEQIKRKSNQ